ncbi:MAG: hypothetical protein ACOYBY_00340 [Dermatophilaceae bacterium]
MSSPRTAPSSSRPATTTAWVAVVGAAGVAGCRVTASAAAAFPGPAAASCRARWRP